MDPSFEAGFLLDMSPSRCREDEDDPFDIRSLIHSSSKTVPRGAREDPKTETLIQIEEDPWGVMDWDRLRSEASALAALTQEENTDWDAIELEASAVAGSIKLGNIHQTLLSHSPMSPLSLDSPLSTIFSTGISLDSSSSTPTNSSHKKLDYRQQRTPLTPANHHLPRVSASEAKKKPISSYLPRQPSTLTKKPSTGPFRLPTTSATSRSISVPKKGPPPQPEMRRSISNLSSTTLQSFKDDQAVLTTGPPSNNMPYMKKSLTLPRKRPPKQQVAVPKTNTTPSGPLRNGSCRQAPPNNSSIVSSTPAHKGNASGSRSSRFAQPGLPSPIVKYSRLKK